MPEGSTLDETETDTKQTGDEEDQPPAEDTAVAAAPTPDSPDSPSAEDQVEVKAVGAVPEPTTVPDVVDEVTEVVAPVQMNEVSDGEWCGRIRLPMGFLRHVLSLVLERCCGNDTY